jgi:hypothetical protein
MEYWLNIEFHREGDPLFETGKLQSPTPILVPGIGDTVEWNGDHSYQPAVSGEFVVTDRQFTYGRRESTGAWMCSVNVVARHVRVKGGA